MKSVSLHLLLMSSLLIISCEKAETDLIAENEVNFYLLEHYAMIPDKCQIDNATIEIKDIIIANDDIQSYHPTEYKLILTDKGIDQLKQIGDAIPFCVKVGHELVYSGFFKPNYSSSSCLHSITINPLPFNDNEIKINLGYPGILDNEPVHDLRNDNRILHAFALQEKLK